MFVHCNDDDVYGSLTESGQFSEKSNYMPLTPFAASRVGQNVLIQSFFHSFKLNYIITHTSDLIGIGQNPNKLLGRVLRSIRSHLPITIYGDGNQLLDWLSIQDYVQAISIIYHKSQYNHTINIGGFNELTIN